MNYQEFIEKNYKMLKKIEFSALCLLSFFGGFGVPKRERLGVILGAKMGAKANLNEV